MLLQSQTAPILNLPTETLQDIFSWLDPFLNVLPARHSPSKRHYLPIFALRSVCLTFRILANEMQFWYKEKEFDLADIIRVPLKRNPGSYNSDDWEEVDIIEDESQESEDEQEGDEDEGSDDEVRPGSSAQDFLKVLLTDKHLVQCLGRRVHWRFKDIDTLPIVMEYVPSFKDLISITLGSKRASPTTSWDRGHTSNTEHDPTSLKLSSFNILGILRRISNHRPRIT